MIVQPKKSRTTTPDAQLDSSLVDQGYSVIRRRILRGEYAPRSKLNLISLQRSMQLSSSPLREALNRLVGEGLVAAEGRRGFRTSGISIAELEELTDLRVLLETAALRRSITLGDDAWEGSVLAANHRCRKAERCESGANGFDLDEWSHLHREFHLALLGGGGRSKLLSICAANFDLAERYRRIARLSAQPRRKDLEHEKLKDAALRRDVESAAKILESHIRKTTQRVIEVLQDVARVASSSPRTSQAPRRQRGRTVQEVS